MKEGYQSQFFVNAKNEFIVRKPIRVIQRPGHTQLVYQDTEKIRDMAYIKNQ